MPGNCLLTKAKYAEPISNKVQTFEAKGLGRGEDRWNPHPTSVWAGNSNEPKQIVSLEPTMLEVAERWAIR